MQNSAERIPLPALVLICSLLFVVAAASAGTSKAKVPAPRFNATTTGGEKFNNDSIKGKVVLLEFWTTWCGYCLKEAGFVDRINDAYAKKGLVILAINVGESKKTVKKYLAEHPRTTRIVLTDDTNLAAMFAAKSYPIYVVIDRDGNVAGEQRGAAGEGALRDLLARGGLEDEEDDDK
ncbi:MAG TPA: TlpA disulfide reductase family protein [Candidatus Angelobacter sp.]|nr:TlpA disulfide reductase family protein [Candidatus Angelobacter sp.]